MPDFDEWHEQQTRNAEFDKKLLAWERFREMPTDEDQDTSN